MMSFILNSSCHYNVLMPTLFQISQANALPITHKKAFYMSCSQNMNDQQPTMSHAFMCICTLRPCDCWGM